jgi:hypothetical protein
MVAIVEHFSHRTKNGSVVPGTNRDIFTPIQQLYNEPVASVALHR